jgi:hypothetical protein
MRNKGFMYGVSGTYTYHPNKFMLKVDGRFSVGNLDYWSAGSGTLDGKRKYNFETSSVFGVNLKTKNEVFFTPFMGLGYRYLFDGSESMISTPGAQGYDRKSNYLYSPIGMETMFRLGAGWRLGFDGEYDHLWHGWQYSEIGHISILGITKLSNITLKNDQANGWGARGSIKLTRRFGRVSFLTKPYFRYWNIGVSDHFDYSAFGIIVYQPREPANTTTEWGLKIGIGF